MNTIRVPYKEMGYNANSCFDSVKAHVEKHGGRSVYCWILHEEEFWLSQLHHAIWETPGRELVCITPQLLRSAVKTLLLEGDREVLIDEESRPFVSSCGNRLLGLPSRHLPKSDKQWVVSACKYLDEEERLTTAAEKDRNLVPLALEAHKRANYWVGKGGKNWSIDVNQWLYQFSQS